MTTRSIRTATALAAVALLAGALPAAAAIKPLPQLPVARTAMAWLASQVNPSGYIPGTSGPDLSDTALVPISAEAAGTHAATARAAVAYLESNVDSYVTEDGHDGPGQLATLILDAVATGASPTDFGGTNLVARLEATMRTSGAQAGLFGVQSATYDGAYRQGLSLIALAAAGVVNTPTIRPAITWLKDQQCPSGGWEAYRATVSHGCGRSDPTTYSGPDTNSTALAIEGLRAQRVNPVHSPLSFLAGLEATHGGWGYYGAAADPDSTALVMGALTVLNQGATAARWVKHGNDPTAVLLGFRLSNGAFYYPISGSPDTANLLATEQAIVALGAYPFPRG